MSLPDLITTSRATQNASLGTLNSTNPGYLASLITTASDAIRSTTAGSGTAERKLTW